MISISTRRTKKKRNGSCREGATRENLACVAGFLGFGGGEGEGTGGREGRKACHNPTECCAPPQDFGAKINQSEHRRKMKF